MRAYRNCKRNFEIGKLKVRIEDMICNFVDEFFAILQNTITNSALASVKLKLNLQACLEIFESLLSVQRYFIDPEH